MDVSGTSFLAKMDVSFLFLRVPRGWVGLEGNQREATGEATDFGSPSKCLRQNGDGGDPQDGISVLLLVCLETILHNYPQQWLVGRLGSTQFHQALLVGNMLGEPPLYESLFVGIVKGTCQDCRNAYRECLAELVGLGSMNIVPNNNTMVSLKWVASKQNGGQHVAPSFKKPSCSTRVHGLHSRP